jgi:transaldolase
MDGESSPKSPNRKVPRTAPANQLEALKEMTTVVADTGDYEKIKQFKPQDATTNPTLILQAVQASEYQSLVSSVLEKCKALGLSGDALVEEICDRLAVQFGVEILKIIPGRVSTEVDACLSFDVQGSVAKANKLLALYEEHGIGRERILIKLASTWEGVEACRILEREGIHCNMTLIFSYEQAIACAQAGATLISPFVGRILDWNVKHHPSAGPYTNLTDPGVVSVTQIFKYFKAHGHATTVMGASFRSKEEILGLAGIDALTISPKLLDELEKSTDELERVLDPKRASGLVEQIPRIEVTEPVFRWALNADQMATDKLSEGIRNFNKDLQKLRDMVKTKLGGEH